MEHKKLLHRFWPRLMLHALLLCAVNGVITGAVCVFAVSGVYHMLICAPAMGTVLGIFGIGFLLGFGISMTLHYPTARRIAAKLDATGLQERSGTMLAFAKKQGTLVQLQRKDAITHIRQTDPGQLPCKLPPRRLLICAVAVILAIGMLLIPYNIFAPDSGLSAEELARAREVDALISQLRQEIYGTNLSEEILEKLEEILQQLEKDLLSTDDQLEQAVLIEQARQDMSQVMRSSISRYSIGAAMQRYELPRPLGKNIADDVLGISDTMDELQLQLENDRALVTKLSNNLSAALEYSGVSPEDPLYMAVKSFAGGLAGLSYSLNPTLTQDTEEGYEEEIYEEADPEDPEALATVFQQGEEAIMQALDEQLLLEAEFEQVDDVMTQGLQNLAGEKNEASGSQFESSGGQMGNQDDSSLGGGSQGSSGQVGGMASGPAGNQPSTMLEEVYDPISGSVTYGQVFSAYYAQYLQALESGEISEELQELFDLYYSALS